MSVILRLWALPAKTKLIIAGLIFALLIVAYIGYLSHEARKADQQTKAAQIEANRQKDKADGLGILVNTNTIAGEVENEKKNINRQQINADLSNAALDSSRRRDSGAFSNNRAAVSARFCRNFPDDESCRR